MNIKGRVQKVITIGGENFNQNTTPVGDGVVVTTVNVPAAKPSTLILKSGDDEGAISAPDSGMEYSALVDIWWTGGLRRGMTAEMDSMGNIAISGGNGDALPAESTAVLISIPIIRKLGIKRAREDCIAYASEGDGYFDLVDYSGYTITRRVSAGSTYLWEEGSGIERSRFFIGTIITELRFSHCELSPKVMRAGLLYRNE